MAALNLLNLMGEVPDGDTASIGWRTYEWDDQADPRISKGRVRMPAFMGRASATCKLDDLLSPQDGDTEDLHVRIHSDE